VRYHCTCTPIDGVHRDYCQLSDAWDPWSSDIVGYGHPKITKGHKTQAEAAAAALDREGEE
jgi:hypothetical protein